MGLKRCQCGCLLLGHDRERGWCSSCEVDSWPEEKRKAIGHMVAVALQGKADKIPAAVERALAVMDEDA
jgi:G:T/U-mismatch repair DNA glycosylase